MSSKSTVDLFNGLLAGLKENDKLKAQYNLQPPVMAQQQVPQVQIPMAPPAPQQPIPPVQAPPTTGNLPDPSGFQNIPTVAESAERFKRQSQVDHMREALSRPGRNLGQLASGVASLPGMVFGDSLDSAENLGSATRDAITMPSRMVRSMLPGGEAAQFVERTVVDPYIEPAVEGVVDHTSATLEALGDPLVRFGQGVAGVEATGVPAGTIPRIGGRDPVPATGGDPTATEIPTLPGQEIPVVPATQPAVTPTQPVVTPTQPAATGGSNLTQQDAEEAEAVITTPVKTDADAVVKGAGTPPKKDAPPEEKEGFLKGLWNGMKDMFKEGMEDPAFRKTLFAYVGSKALGYDGVTFAGQVLENEWKVQAAERKQEFELEKIYGKEGLATLKAQKKAKAIDPSKVATIYDKTTETNLTGAFSADGTMVRLDNANFYESLGIEPDANGVYPVLSVAAVRAAQGGGRFSVGVGLTGNDIISNIRANIDLDVDNAIDTYISNQNLDTEDAERLTTKIKGAINGTVRNGAAKAFKSFYPAGTDFSDFNLQEISTNAVIKYIDSVGRGMEGNSKNLAAFMEKERLKVESKFPVSSSFFSVVGDDSEDAIGGEVWSKATAKVKYLASAFGKEIGAEKVVPKAAVWSNLERLYNQQAEEMGDEFKIFWNSESKDSADVKGQGASPALLWIMSMDRNKSATNSKFFAGSMQEVINKMK